MGTRPQAGRELDVLVADQVMGWTITAPNWGNREVFPPFSDCDCISHREAATVPEYSTDIAAAWEVVREFAEGATRRDVYPKIWWDKQGDYWTCQFGQDFTGTGATAPLAICLAALRVVGYDFE